MRFNCCSATWSSVWRWKEASIYLQRVSCPSCIIYKHIFWKLQLHCLFGCCILAWVAQSCLDHVVWIWNNCCFLILGLWQMLQKSKFDSENNRLGLFKIVEMIYANWCVKSKIKSKWPIRFEIRIKGKMKLQISSNIVTS